MSDAIAQMEEERDRPQEQQQHPDRRSDEGVRRGEDLAARRHGYEPPGEQDRAHRKRNAGEPLRTEKADVI